MYFCIMCDRNIATGEVAVLKRNNHGELCCYLIDGTYVGYVCSKQPDGCVDFWDIAANIGANKILCTVTIKANRLLIMYTDSRVLTRDVHPAAKYEERLVGISA